MSSALDPELAFLWNKLTVDFEALEDICAGRMNFKFPRVVFREVHSKIEEAYIRVFKAYQREPHDPDFKALEIRFDPHALKVLAVDAGLLNYSVYSFSGDRRPIVWYEASHNGEENMHVVSPSWLDILEYILQLAERYYAALEVLVCCYLNSRVPSGIIHRKLLLMNLSANS